MQNEFKKLMQNEFKKLMQNRSSLGIVGLFISKCDVYMSGLTNYNVKDPFGNFIDLSYIFMPRTGYQLLTNLKSNNVDIGSLFQPLITITDLSTNAIVQPAAKDLSYVYYLFDKVGTNTNGYLITNGNIGNVHCVAIGGGGGGGVAGNGGGGGGGGAGGMIKETVLGLSASSTIYINVGLGGLSSNSANAKGSSGGLTDISFNTTRILAGGGGGGGSSSAGSRGGIDGNPVGGSGGGGCNGNLGGIGNSPGTAGGSGRDTGGGGGGGGAGGGGSNGGNGGNTFGGAGGGGLSINSKLTDATAYSTIFCVGGGGAGNNTNGNAASTYGSGGAGSNSLAFTNGYQGAAFLVFDYKPIVDIVII